MASNHITKRTLLNHLEALAEKVKRTTECWVRQSGDYQVRMATRMKIMMLIMMMPIRPPVHHGTQSLHLEQGLLAFLGNMIIYHLQSEERKSGEKQVQGIEE